MTMDQFVAFVARQAGRVEAAGLLLGVRFDLGQIVRPSRIYNCRGRPIDNVGRQLQCFGICRDTIGTSLGPPLDPLLSKQSVRIMHIWPIFDEICPGTTLRVIRRASGNGGEANLPRFPDC